MELAGVTRACHPANCIPLDKRRLRDEEKDVAHYSECMLYACTHL